MSLCAWLARLDYQQWARECRHFISNIELTTYACQLNNTVKTHKPAGRLSVRLLDNFAGSALLGLSGVVDRLLVEAAQNRFPHLATSSDDVQDFLRDKVFPHTIQLYKADIAEFFLSGEHDFLIRHACSLFLDKALRSWIDHALHYLLHYQAATFEGIFYKVYKGNGMGNRHSGSLASFAFAIGVEEPFLKDCRIHNRGLHGFLRYFDDILFMCEDSMAGDLILALLRRWASPQFSIQLDASSPVSVQMLDMHLHKIRCGPSSPDCRIAWRPYVKPTSRHLPLHHHSFHHSSVHKSWALAEMLRMFRRSSRLFEFERARELKLQRWAYFFMHKSLLDACRA